MLIYVVIKDPKDLTKDIVVSTKFDISKHTLHDIGGGFRVILVQTSTTGTAVICSRTGGIFGGTLEHTRSEVKKHNLREGERRIRVALSIKAKAKYIPIDQFWSQIRLTLEASIKQ